MSKCFKCAKNTDRYGDTIFCTGICKGVFHLDCVNITIKQFTDMRSDKSINQWQCNSCLVSASDYTLPRAPNSLEAKIDFMLSKQTQFQTSMEHVQKSLDEILTENEVYRLKIDELEKRCANLEEKISDLTTKNTPEIIEQTINEISERQTRSKNILLFNVPESVLPSTVERSEQDLTLTKKIVTVLHKGPVDTIKVFRLGRHQADRRNPRPLKVILPSPHIAKQILKNKSKLPNEYKPIVIRSDDTPMQRTYLKEVIQDLEARKQNGDSDISIKYIRGMPCITPVPRQSKND